MASSGLLPRSVCAGHIQGSNSPTGCRERAATARLPSEEGRPIIQQTVVQEWNQAASKSLLLGRTATRHKRKVEKVMLGFSHPHQEEFRCLLTNV